MILTVLRTTRSVAGAPPGGDLEELDGLPLQMLISALQLTPMEVLWLRTLPDRVYWRGALPPRSPRGQPILAEPEDGHVLTSDHMWLSFQRESNAGHDGKVSVGRIDRAWIADGMLWGFGEIDMKDETGVAQEVARKMRDGFMGTISIDPADIEDADIETRLYTVDDELVDVDSWDADDLYEAIEAGLIRERSYFSTWRLAGATLVQDPAFHTSRGEKSSAFIEIVDADAIVAAVVGNTELGFADLDHPWDEEEALKPSKALSSWGRAASGGSMTPTPTPATLPITCWRSPRSWTGNCVRYLVGSLQLLMPSSRGWTFPSRPRRYFGIGWGPTTSAWQRSSMTTPLSPVGAGPTGEFHDGIGGY